MKQEQQAYISKAVPKEKQADIRNRIELLLSEILSDQHGCKVSLKFEKENDHEKK